MGDRAYVEVTLYGVAGHEWDIVDLFVDWGGSIGADHASASDIHNGMTICDDERLLGAVEEIGPTLEALGISYLVEQAGHYEYGPELRMFTPDLGVFESSSNGTGSPVATASTIDRIIRDFTDGPGTGIGSLLRALDQLTGRAHREWFAARRAEEPTAKEAASVGEGPGAPPGAPGPSDASAARPPSTRWQARGGCPIGGRDDPARLRRLPGPAVRLPSASARPALLPVRGP